MNYKPDIHRRRSIRLKGYDYSRAGTYFVTIVTQGMTCCFGDVASDEMCLNDAGRMACRVWESLRQRFPGIKMGAFVVMPNHIHGIIIVEAALVDAQDPGTVGIPNPGATTRVALTGGRVTLNQYQGGMCICRVRGSRPGISNECFGL